MPDKPKSLIEVHFDPQGKVFSYPSDWRDQFIYFLPVDRFNSAEKNIPLYDPVTTPVGRDDSEGENWQGGTLKGVIDRLDYIKENGTVLMKENIYTPK
jgi:hypothetical protein